MAAGYLDLLQRELRKAVVHAFVDEVTLDATAGIDGQIAFTTAEGNFYIFTAGEWKRILDEDDLATMAASGVQVVSADIPNLSALTFTFAHGLAGRPQIEVTAGPTNKLVVVEVAHDEAGNSTLTWKGTIPGPAKATATGVPI